MSDHLLEARLSRVSFHTFDLGRPLAVVAATLLAAALAAPAAAAYPDRPVRVIVPFPPGGAVDVVGRVIAQKLGERLGHNFFVENVGGAAGNLGTQQAAKAAPDGHTLLVAFSSHVVNPSIFASVPYDAVADFEPISLAVIAANVLVVSAAVEARSVKALVELVRANPGKYNFAAATNTQAHLLGLQFVKIANLDLVHVPFTGAGPVIASVVGGHTPIGLGTLASAITQIEAGQLRPLAMLSSRRVTSLPDVPTIAEAGYPELDGDVWIGVLAPAKTPADILDRLNAEIVDMLKRPDVTKLFEAQGLTPGAGPRAEFAKRIREELPLWRKIVESTKAK